MSPEKEPSNTIIIIVYIGLCVSSYYLTIVSDCPLPFGLHVQSTHMCRVIIVGHYSGHILLHGNINNIIAVLVTKRVEYMILFWPPKVLYG